MLNKKELGLIRKALPKDGYQRVATRTGYDTSTVGKALREPKRFNKKIIDNALVVIEEYKSEVEALQIKIKQVVS